MGAGAPRVKDDLRRNGSPARAGAAIVVLPPGWGREVALGARSPALYPFRAGTALGSVQPIEILVAGPYNGFDAAGFAVAFGIAAWYGWRAGWEPLPWFALLAGCVAGGIAGSRLLFFDLHAHAPGEKTVLGGMAGGLLALFLLQRFLGVRASAARVLAPAALLGCGLGRVGCFLAGCCFGTPTSLPWGVRYATGTPPFEAQSAGGLLDAAADVSHAVHPTQLYEAVLAVLLAAALARWGARCRSVGGVAIGLIIGVAVIRLGVQPFRHVTAAHLILGLQPVQWAMLLASATAATTLALRERAARVAGTAAESLPQRVPALRGALVVSGILGLILFLGGWLTPLERVVLASAVVPSGLLLMSRFLARRPYWRPAPSCWCLWSAIPSRPVHGSPSEPAVWPAGTRPIST
jgi:prolipoprotein diacylglyceryltransferase